MARKISDKIQLKAKDAGRLVAFDRALVIAGEITKALGRLPNELLEDERAVALALHLLSTCATDRGTNTTGPNLSGFDFDSRLLYDAAKWHVTRALCNPRGIKLYVLGQKRLQQILRRVFEFKGCE